MSLFHPRPLRGRLDARPQSYGQSVLGAPLLWFPAPLASEDSGLILAGTHGDETAAVVTLSCAMRTLQDSHRRHHVVLAVNPDGCQLGLRANANGVDLNRNFPAANWQHGETVYRWNSVADERDVLLSTGEHAGSEPETAALCQLIHRLSPPGLSLFMSRWPVSKTPIAVRWVTGWRQKPACRWSAASAMPRRVLSAAGVRISACPVLRQNSHRWPPMRPANAIWGRWSIYSTGSRDRSIRPQLNGSAGSASTASQVGPSRSTKRACGTSGNAARMAREVHSIQPSMMPKP